MIDLNNPDVLKVLLAVLGIVGTVALILLEGFRRRTKEAETKLASVESEAQLDHDESTRETNAVNALVATAASITKMAEAQIARADAQDKERIEWRASIDAATMAKVEHIGELRRMGAAIEQLIPSVQETAKLLIGMNNRAVTAADVRKVVAEQREKGVQAITESLDTILDVLLTLYDAATQPGGEIVGANRRQIEEALAEAALLRVKTAQITMTDVAGVPPPDSPVTGVAAP